MLRLADGFDTSLRALREAFRAPMILTSACRGAAYNAAIGGHPRSLHVCDTPHHLTGGCCAIDVKSQGEEYDETLRWLAWDMGWSVGYGHGFTHLDRRIDYRRADGTEFTQARFTY